MLKREAKVGCIDNTTMKTFFDKLNSEFLYFNYCPNAI